MKDEQLINPLSTKETRKFIIKAAVITVVGMPFTLAGIVLCLSIVGIPLGVPLLMVSGAPLAYLHKRRSQEISAWRARERAMPNQEVKPWEM
jgi:uncharacterized membrane protein YccF (DUF307 family)